MPHKIIDTNVPLTAAGVNDAATDSCQLSCVQIIKRSLAGEIVVVIDEDGEVLSEYRSNMYPDPNPSAGLASQFLIYLFNNQAISSRVHPVKLKKNADNRFVDYPDKKNSWQTNDIKCRHFDPDDKKWVALALRFKKETHGDAPIVNAADRCWQVFAAHLESVGIQLESLCRDT